MESKAGVYLGSRYLPILNWVIFKTFPFSYCLFFFTFKAIFKLVTLPSLNLCPTSVAINSPSSQTVLKCYFKCYYFVKNFLFLNHKMFSLIVHVEYEDNKA